MHSFHHSRGRILFEVFCALAISASLVGAWLQTDASALLAVAAVSALYGLVHAFDATVARRVAVANPEEPACGTTEQGAAPLAATDRQVATDNIIEDSELVEPAAPQKMAGRRAKAPRKGGGRRASAPKTAKVAEIAPLVEADVAELAPAEEAEVAVLMAPEEATYSHIEPLFEPEPFVRMPRRAFGRKAG